MGRRGLGGINPVEGVIFLAVLGVFANSLYHLVQLRGSGGGAGRALASLASTGNGVQAESGDLLVVGCASNLDHLTQRDELRIRGMLCGAKDLDTSRKLIKAEVINTANRARPLVYADRGNGSFESGSIPLRAGDNAIFMKFVYAGGKVVSQRLVVRRGT